MANLKSDEQAQNDLNIKLKQLPWYQAFLAQSGQNPQKVKLSGDQRKQLQAIAAQNGVTLPKGVQFDPSGNVNEQHGFAGQPGWAKALEIGGAIAAGGYFAAPLLAGGGASMSASEAALAGTGGFAPSAAAAAVPAVGTIAKVAQAAKTGLSTYDKINNVLGDAGKSIGAATSAAGENRLEANTAAERAAHQNLLDKIARENADANQASLDRRSVYRSSVAKNPTFSQFNTRPQTLSPEMMSGLSDMEKQALTRINAGPTPFVPFTPKPASTLEQVGNWASPIASTISAIGKYL